MYLRGRISVHGAMVLMVQYKKRGGGRGTDDDRSQIVGTSDMHFTT